MTSRVAFVVAISLLVATTQAGTAAAANDSRPTVTGCDGVLAVVLVPFQDADAVVPEEFSVLDDAGNAEVFLDTFTCDRIALGSRTAQGIEYAVAAISINPPAACDASCREGTQFYLLSWVSDASPFTSWLKDGTGLEDRVRLVTDMTARRVSGAPGVWDWEFASPTPSPDPFTMAAHASDASATTGSFSVFWRRTTEGLVQVQTRPDVETFGAAAGDATVLGSTSSELADAFGGESTRNFAGLSANLARGAYSKTVFV